MPLSDLLELKLPMVKLLAPLATVDETGMLWMEEVGVFVAFVVELAPLRLMLL